MGKKRQIITTIVCACTGICLAGGICIAVMSQRNPLAGGLKNLAEEVTALEEEVGESFWSDAVNQIGSGNIQAEYSLNMGGIPDLQNIMVGLDGTVRRDMENGLLETDIRWSVANTRIAEGTVSVAADTLYLQVPSLWEGSAVFKTEDVDGQWNSSVTRRQLEKLTGVKLDIRRNMNIRPLQEFTVPSFSATDFLRENEENLKALYENMDILSVEKARKKGLLSEGQAKSLGDSGPKDAEGNGMAADCYLMILPGKELGKLFRKETGDLRLCIYLDSRKRIVKVCTLPGEILVTELWEGCIELNLTGREATIDRMDGKFSGVGDWEKIPGELSGKLETEGSFLVEKESESERTFAIKSDAVLVCPQNTLAVSLEGTIVGEYSEKGKSVFLELENLMIESGKRVQCRMSGRAAFEPLTEEVVMPSGKEYRIGEMGELETVRFLTECVENIYKNYGGYIRMLEQTCS